MSIKLPKNEIVSLFAGLVVSLGTFAYPTVQPDRSRLYWILGAFCISLILQALTWKYTYKWAIGAIAESKKKEFEEQKKEQEARIFWYCLEQIDAGKAKCGKCGKTIYGRYSVASKDNGAIVLCDSCFPWKEKGTTEVGGLVFHHGKRKKV